MGVPPTGTVQEQYSHHLRYDAIVANPATGACFTHDYNENLYGHRSGVGNSTPWSTPPTRPTPSTYQDAGTASATAATTLTDGAKSPVWTTNMWVGKTVFAVGTGGALSKLVVTSNSGTVLTGSGGWSNGTPGNVAYIVGPDALAGASAKFADNWWQQLRLLYNPGAL